MVEKERNYLLVIIVFPFLGNIHKSFSNQIQPQSEHTTPEKFLQICFENWGSAIIYSVINY